MDDPNLEQSGAGEEALDLELEPEVAPKEPLPAQGGDPLDDIQDPVARAEAKKWRAIARRSKDDSEEHKEEPTPTQTPEFLTKAEFFKANEKNAIREVITDPEVKANWSEIIPFYTPRRGKETKEDILEDIKDAIILFKARNPVIEEDDSANELTATPVVKTGGGPIEKGAIKPKDPPNFKLPTQPKDWYQKKES